MDDDYITVVEVDDPTSKDKSLLQQQQQQQLVKRQSSIPEDSSFITVLTINNNNNLSSDKNHKNDDDNKAAATTTATTKTAKTETNNTNTVTEVEFVTVYRLPGERLGFGLKFQGGTRSMEKVQKLYIQSCAKDSPASKVATSWGLLREGDEILSIDGQRVSDMTRIECVRGLKDNVAIKLEVRNGHGQKPQTIEEPAEPYNDEAQQLQQQQHQHQLLVTNMGNGLSKISSPLQPPPPPPPVPPRKLVKRVSLKEQQHANANANANGGGFIEIDLNGGGQQQQSSVAPNKPFTPPPDAEYYINLFADDQSLKTESESDDTASTISTVIDKFSLNSNYSSETDLSSFASLSNGGAAAAAADLAKVLKPFTMLEQEFKVNELVAATTPPLLTPKPAVNIIPGNNYENVEFKTEKINVYENVELSATAMPTPKPRQVPSNLVTTSAATIEPKKRSILPMPRKLTGGGAPIKLPIEVAPPKLPESALMRNNNNNNKTETTSEPKTPTNEQKLAQTTVSEVAAAATTSVVEVLVNKTPTAPTNAATPKIKQTNKATELSKLPTATACTSSSSPHSKEFMTKIPKAIAAVFSPNTQRGGGGGGGMERAKTESEIKLQANKLQNLQQVTALFLAAESKAAAAVAASNNKNSMVATKTPVTPTTTPITATTTPLTPKSRIPIVQGIPRRNVETATPIAAAPVLAPNSPTILHHSSNIPRMLMQKQKSETDLKLGLYRSKSKESTSPLPTFKTPLQRTISAESKLKSPERTLIPVFSGSNVSNSSTESLNTSFTSSTSSLNTTKAKGPKPKPPERVQSLTKSPTQIPKLNAAATPVSTAVIQRSSPKLGQIQVQGQHQYTPPSPSQIPTMQTFKQQTPTNSPNREIRFKIQTYESKAQANGGLDATVVNNVATTAFTDVNGNESEKLPSLFDLMQSGKQTVKLLLDDEPMLDRETPPPLVVGKCVKINDAQQTTYYSSSSSSDDDAEETTEEQSVDDVNKDYDCEDGEKLGPPEVINGPGPSEAYFNLYWHSNMLPTIGEVAEEELSSLEPQSLSNGPLVIVDDLSQQKTAGVTAKTKKSPLIGMPVLPPTVPNMELENKLQSTTVVVTQNANKNKVKTHQQDQENKDSNKNAKLVDKQNEDKLLLDDANVVDNAMTTTTTTTATKIIENLKQNSFEDADDADDDDDTLVNTVNEVVEQTLQAAVKYLEAQQVHDEANKTVAVEAEISSSKDIPAKIDEKIVVEEIQENFDEKMNKKAHDEDMHQMKSDASKPQTQTTMVQTETQSNSKSVTEEKEESEAVVEPAAANNASKSSSSPTTTAATKQIKTTTKKKVIKTTSSTTSTTHSSASISANGQMDAALSEQLQNELLDVVKEATPKLQKKQATTATTTPANTPLTPIAFTLQPYTERHTDANTKITVRTEERQYESAEKCYTQILSRNSKGEEQLEQKHESHEERAKLKKIQQQKVDNDNGNDDEKAKATATKLMPLSITAATAETQITELAEQPLDKQSIERGILHLSESGQQMQCNESGELLALVECERQVQDSFEHLKRDLSEKTADDETTTTTKPAILTREISECLTLTKDGEKQVSKRAELTKEQFHVPAPTPTPKKGAKLVKMSEDEKRLEREARELIENYQKVKKEAEKLFQNDQEVEEAVNDDDGFKLEAATTPTQKIEPTKETPPQQLLTDFLSAERASALPAAAAAAPAATESQPATTNKPPALPTSAIPDLLLETEPLYVLHKNIIDDTNNKAKTLPSKLSTKELNEMQRTPPVPQRRGSMGLAMTTTITAVTTTNAFEHEKPKPTPPTPTKRLSTKQPTIDAVDHALTMTNKSNDIQATVAAAVPQPLEITETTTITTTTTKPIERIIVGVEHQLELPATVAPTTPSASSVGFGGGAAAAGAAVLSNTSSGKSLHLESINLPNVNAVNGACDSNVATANANTPSPIQQTPILMSTSSSAAAATSHQQQQQQQQKPMKPAASAEMAHLENNGNGNGNKRNSLQHANDDDDNDDDDDVDNVEDLLFEHADIQGVPGKTKMDENGGTSLIMQQSTTTTVVALPPHQHQHHHHQHQHGHGHGAAPPPAYSRLPPDGHEFPPNFCEPADLGALLLSGSSNNNNNNEPESRIYLEKKQLQYIDPSNKTATTKTTTTSAATQYNSSPNNNNNKSIIMTSMIETTTTTLNNNNNNNNKQHEALPPPLPKSVPPPPTTTTTTASASAPAPTARKIYREQLVVNIEAANDEAKAAAAPRRSSSTLSLSSTPASGSSTPTTAEFRPSLRSARKPSDWHKDEKSERSVRDKIAMFSMDDSGSCSGSGNGNGTNGSMSGSTPHLNVSCSSSRNGSRKALNLSSENLLDSSSSSGGSIKKQAPPTLKSVQSTGSTSDYFTHRSPTQDIFSSRALSMENLYAAPISSVSKLQQQQHTQQQLSKYSESMQSLDTMPSYYASLPRRHVMQTQTQQIERRTSFSGGQMSDEASRKVANLLEHRRRSITKLRGLVIPERPSTLEPILDLPEIKSRDSEQTAMSDYSTDSGVGSSGSATAVAAAAPRATKPTNANNNSNATYRSIFNHTTSTPQTRAAASNVRSHSSIELLPQPPAKPPRTSLSVLSTPTTPLRPPALLPHQHDESDSDSVFSSKVSSPPMSPMSASNVGGGGGGTSSTISSSSSCSTANTPSVVPEKFALTRTLSSETNTSIASSTTSTLTSGSGSQASCSSVGSTPTVDLSRRIIKPTHGSSSHSHSHSSGNANGVDANAAAAVAAAASRKNILASAKCRSGRGESSLLMRQRNQAPYHDDEDSTDGYDEEEVRRVAHKSRSRSNLANGNSAPSVNAMTAYKTANANPMTNAAAQTPSSSTLINYKLVSKQPQAAAGSINGLHSLNSNSSLVDRVINVAAYVEVTTTTTTASDTDDSSHRSDATNATSPAKISAIFIDEERKASFKSTDASVVVTAKPVKTTTVKTTAAPGVANAKPVKAVMAQQAAAPTKPTPTPTPPPKKSTAAIVAADATDASSELQQWMAKSSAKINAAVSKSTEKCLKPVLAKFERSSVGVANASGNIAVSSPIVLPKSHAKPPPTISTAELRERFERGAAAQPTVIGTTTSTSTTKPLHGASLKSSSNAGGVASSNYLDRFSSLDSVASSSSGVSSSTQNVSSSTHEHNEFGSFSSLGSNQSLITAQDIQQIIEEADPPLKQPEAFIVVLQRDTPETTVGITLAGGANYETKEITVNKILADSPAARDGRLRKGDRILAVNGMSMRGLTHNESVSVLKTPRPEVTLVVTRSESLVVESAPPKKRHALGSLTSLLEKPCSSADTQLVKKESRQTYHSASRSLDIGLDSSSVGTSTTRANEQAKDNNTTKLRNTGSSSSILMTKTKTTTISTSLNEPSLQNDDALLASASATTTIATTVTTRRSTAQTQRISGGGGGGVVEANRQREDSSTATPQLATPPQRHINVCKDNCGLGFSLEGGFDSPLGNRPLLIKKVFYGGAAHRTGQVKPGDEIVAINRLSTAKMTRIEVWNYMNQLPLGDVELVLV